MIKCTVLKLRRRSDNEDDLKELMGASAVSGNTFEGAKWFDTIITHNELSDISLVHVGYDVELDENVIILQTGWGTETIIKHEDRVLKEIENMIQRLEDNYFKKQKEKK